MNFSSSNKPPVYFFITSAIAFVWYGFGIYSYVMQAYVNSATLGSGSNADPNLAINLPLWYISIFAIAIFTGFFGAIFLLIRKKWAFLIFVVSFLATGIQQFYILTEVNPRDIFLSLSALVISVFLIWFSKRATAKGWLK